MQKAFLIVSLAIGLVSIAGCSNPFSSSSDQQSTPVTLETALTADSRQTGVTTCDKYLSVLRCIAASQQDQAGAEYIKTHNDLLNSRKDIPVDQLNNICTSLTNTLIANPQILTSTNCRL